MVPMNANPPTRHSPQRQFVFINALFDEVIPDLLQDWARGWSY